MKEQDHPSLWEAIFDPGNLRRAWKRVRANRGAPGIDGRSVTDFPAWMREHWGEVRARLEAGTYRPAPVRRVEIDSRAQRDSRALFSSNKTAATPAGGNVRWVFRRCWIG